MCKSWWFGRYFPFTFAVALAVPALTLQAVSITVTSPNGSEVWTADTLHTITWSAVEPSGDVDIWCHGAGSTNYRYLATVEMIEGQFPWPIAADFAATNGVIILRSHTDGDTINDASDAPFTILPATAGSLSVLSPTIGENWAAGSTQAIAWSSDFANGEIDLDLYENGEFHTHIATVPVGDGSYSWSLCPGLGDSSDYSIRVAERTLYVDSESDPFQISGSAAKYLEITDPADGSHWRAGSSMAVNWNSGNLVGDMQVVIAADFYSCGYPDVAIGDGSLTWDIPKWVQPGPALVRLFPLDCGFITDSVRVMISSVFDSDSDGDVDYMDLTALVDCISGPAAGSDLTEPCAAVDVDDDGRIDLFDFAAFQVAFTGS